MAGKRTMVNWKRSKRGPKNASSTPGKSKGLSCQATWADRYFAKSSRSYKDPGYENWMINTARLNGRQVLLK